MFNIWWMWFLVYSALSLQKKKYKVALFLTSPLWFPQYANGSFSFFFIQLTKKSTSHFNYFHIFFFLNNKLYYFLKPWKDTYCFIQHIILTDWMFHYDLHSLNEALFQSVFVYQQSILLILILIGLYHNQIYDFLRRGIAQNKLDCGT